LSDQLHRVFFDPNDGSQEFGYDLKFAQSKIDLDSIGKELCEGLRVIVYQPDELEVEAILHFDSSAGCLLASPIKGTWKMLDSKAH
jgi:hypothetical protein